MKRKAFKIALALVVVLAVAIVGGSFYMLDFSLRPDPNKGRNAEAIWKKMKQRCPQDSAWMDSLLLSHCLHDTTITAWDGDRHHAVYVWPRQHQPASRVAVLVHGYTDCYVSMLPIAHIYYNMGYALLLPDLHGNGQSDGEEERMGWQDRLDVKEWIGVASKLFGDKSADGQKHEPLVVVHGVSMGAATVMCLSGEQLPTSVRCFVEDCGYTSVWDEFSGELHEMFHLPDFPLMYTTSVLCRLRYGWSFGQASPLEQVRKCTRPMLFIHGSDDTFVPTSMVYPLYHAKPSPKSLWIAKGAKHARSYDVHPEEYERRVREFVVRYMR